MILKYKLKMIWREIRWIPRGIKNLVKWSSIIWNDCDYDQEFLYKIMHKKIHNMRVFFESDNTMCVDAEKRAKRMFTVECALKRLTDCNHFEIAHRMHNIKWGEIDMKTFPCDFDKEGSVISHQLEISRKNAVTESEKAREGKEFKAACEMEVYLVKQDLELIGKYLTKYSQGWWD